MSRDAQSELAGRFHDRRRELPPPLWGRVGVGGSRESRPFQIAMSKPNRPPSLTLLHKGGGNTAPAVSIFERRIGPGAR